MTWYHATFHRRFEPGEVLLPGRVAGRYGNVLMRQDASPVRGLQSGQEVDMHDVVWICEDADEAENWASHGLLKWLPGEIRQVPAGGIAVYEVEPISLDHPDEQHSATEACCETAIVVREVRYDPFPQDLCDDCGAPAALETLGSDRQLCRECAAEEPT